MKKTVESQAKNPYSFYSGHDSSNGSTVKTSRPTIESAHQLLKNVNELLEKTNKAASFKPENPANIKAVSKLKNCYEVLRTVLNGPVPVAAGSAQKEEGSTYTP